MEASRKPEIIRARIEALYQRYPLDKYIWIEPRMDTASPLPEHFDLAVYVRSIPTESKSQYVYPLKTRWDRNAQEYVADPSGGYALAKPALMGLAADAGIKWPLEGNGRTDDGSNPDVIEWRATGTILTLSGMSPISATKRIDLSIARTQDEMRLVAKPPKEIYRGGQAIKWGDLTDDDREEYIRTKVQENDLQRRANLTEMAESKAQLRVIRSVLGIPSKFDILTLQKKSFATLRIIFAPNPTSPRERQAVLDGMMRMFLPAFPGAAEQAPQQPAQIGTVEAPRQIGAPRQPAEEACEVEVEDDYACDAPQASEQTEASPPPELPPVDPNFLKAATEQKQALCNLLGGEDGLRTYYRVLEAHGYAHANEIPDKETKSKVWRELVQLVKDIKSAPKVAPPPADEPAQPSDPLAPFMESRRLSLGRMDKARVQKDLDELLAAYPKTDPLGIYPRVADAEDKGALADLIIEITRYNIEETARTRDSHNAQRGGER